MSRDECSDSEMTKRHVRSHRNLLIVSMIVLLAASASTAPVEEKEQEEVEVEATEEVEGELSEEEEGVLGSQQTTTAAGGSASGGQSAAGGGTHDGTAGGPAGDSSSVDPAAAGDPSSSADKLQPISSVGSAASAAADVSADQTQPAAAELPAASPHTDTNGADGADSESNGNGQKLLNGGGGGGGGGADSHTGVLGSFVGGVSHLDYTGIIDPSSHDFLLGLMGGGDPFGSDAHINIPGHMTQPTHLDSTVTAAPSTDQDSLVSPAASAHHADVSIDQSGSVGSSVSSGPDQSVLGSVLGSSHSAVASSSSSSSSSSSHSGAHREQTDGVDSPDSHGNGRQTLLTDTNGAVTDRLVSFSDLQNLHTDLTGGAESVTSLHIDLTASGLGLGRDVTESSPVILHTESAGGVTLDPVSGVYSHTDLVTMATDSIGTDTVAADSTGTPFDSSHPAVTDHTQMAGPVTEQYHPSGQGPEGAENVELEDTC
uniref:Uncharacterized LOC110958971 n=1 Tax=Acanthochromis polyacanthus TaxID=80966 RepID=A0A3Q1GMF8_9TELE